MPKTHEVSYTGNPAVLLPVNLIETWDRGSVSPISGSSGLKDYFKNQVWSLFERTASDRVVMVRGNGPPMLLYQVGQQWFDVTGQEVKVKARPILSNIDRSEEL